MTRPITVVFQEQAQLTPTVSDPDLDTLVFGAAYQILDYLDDKEDIQVADYGTLNADNPYTPPVASTPAIVLAAPPGITAGAWVAPTSIGVIFDDLRAILVSRTDGAVTNNDNLLTSAGATFVTTGVAAGDTLIIANPPGPATPNLVLTVREVVSETTLRVTTNFLATVGSLAFRVERTVQDTTIATSFVVPPVFRASNEITILGGVTVTIGGIQRVVSYAKVYVQYLAYRMDLQEVDSVISDDEIRTKVGKIDARNPLAAHLWVARQNAGSAPIYFYGLSSNDLAGYTDAKDVISSNKRVYAEIVTIPDVAVVAMLKTDNVTLADPVTALADGIPQKFRAVIGSEELPVTTLLVDETVTGTTEQRSGAIPPGVRTITLGAGVNLLTSNVRPGDQLILTASEGVLDGTYTIAHINSASVLETDTAFPATVGAAEGANIRVYRPSLGTNPIAEIEARASYTTAAVTYRSRVAGITPGARTIALVQSGSTPNGIHSVIEVAGVSTVINGDFASGLVTATGIVNALTTGAGVTTPFVGSVNLSATTSSGATVQAAFAATALSTGTPGLDSITSTAALDAVFIRIFDSTATFLTDGVQAGDVIEIPSNPNGVFGSTYKSFVVNEVLSEQRIEIANIATGVYVNNTGTVENELPHLDNRLGTGTLVTQGSIRYRVQRVLNKERQVEYLQSISQSLRSQRAVMAWPDLVDVADLVDGSLPRNADGSAALAASQAGTYLAAAIGGLCAGLPNHQGLSRISIAGVRKLYHSSGYFTEAQLSALSDAGWFVFVQDTPESLPFCIHQLTTDPSSLQTGEFSMVRNFDFLSKFFTAILDPFIGVWNVNEETLGFMRQAVNSGIDQLKLRKVARIGAPLIDALITSLDVSDASPDRVELYMTVNRPVPLNVIGLHLVG